MFSQALMDNNALGEGNGPAFKITDTGRIVV